ncbi:MAG: hypothetical protein KKF50_04685 [Nanoarchaeota archaeon]|nr:hypothetical protein [Nanoarchaeota archaeon]
MKRKFIIKDWYITPSWARGLAIGTIVGSILMIPSAFLVKSPIALLLPVAILITCSAIGTLTGKRKKEFGLSHRPNY